MDVNKNFQSDYPAVTSAQGWV